MRNIFSMNIKIVPQLSRSTFGPRTRSYVTLQYTFENISQNVTGEIYL